MQRLILVFIVFLFLGCSRKDFIDMNDVYIKDNVAYLIKDNSLVNGKVRSYGTWKKPGITAIFNGKKVKYEGYYSNGLKDYKWLNFEPDKSLQEGRVTYIKKIKEIWNVGELLKIEYYDASENILETKYYNGSGCSNTANFNTNYLVQNDSSTDIILTIDNGVQRQIKRKSNWFISNTNHCDSIVIPSKNNTFKSLQIHKGDAQNNLILIYEHEKILDSMWNLNEKSNNEFEYTLIITDDLFD